MLGQMIHRPGEMYLMARRMGCHSRSRSGPNSTSSSVPMKMSSATRRISTSMSRTEPSAQSAVTRSVYACMAGRWWAICGFCSTGSICARRQSWVSPSSTRTPWRSSLVTGSFGPRHWKRSRRLTMIWWLLVGPTSTAGRKPGSVIWKAGPTSSRMISSAVSSERSRASPCNTFRPVCGSAWGRGQRWLIRPMPPASAAQPQIGRRSPQ